MTNTDLDTPDQLRILMGKPSERLKRWDAYRKKAGQQPLSSWARQELDRAAGYANQKTLG